MKRCPLCYKVDISSRSKACAECHRIRRNACARRDRISSQMGCRVCYRDPSEESTPEPVVAGESSPALDGSALIPEELIDGYINHLSWSDKATDREKTLVAGNIRAFAYWLRTHMYGLHSRRCSDANTP